MTEKETIELENQLRSWTPRRPSPRLERGLFGFAAPAALAEEPLPGRRHGTPRFAFLVPATTALVLLACGWLNQRYGTAEAHSGNSGPLVAMILSNQSAAAYLPASFDHQQNRLANVFEWTNGHVYPSSVPSLSVPKSNNL
jgi:hypothetical protein